MFRGCSSLTTLDLSSFDTSHVTIVKGMLQGCSSLKSLNLSSFDTSKLAHETSVWGDMFDGMFNGCDSLERVELGAKTTKLDGLPSNWINGRSDWFSVKADKWVTSEEIFNSRLGIADTYTKVDPTPTVTFDSAGGSSVAAQNLVGGAKATKPANPTRANYVFVAWTLDGETYDFTKPVTGNITLKATWAPMTYIVAFDSHGGSQVGSQTVEVHKTAVKPSDPVRAGFDFSGWLLNGALYDFATPVTSNITLLAAWKDAKYTVSFDSAEGSPVASQIVVGGTTAVKPISPTREGYAFAGWLLNGAQYDFATPVTSNIELVASWEQADVSYTADGDWAAGAVGAVDGGTDLSFQNEIVEQSGASEVAQQAWSQASSLGAATIICVDVKLFVIGANGEQLSELTEGLSIKVSLAVDPQYNGRKVKVTQVHEGQAIDHPEADRVRNGAVKLDVTELSEFVIAVDNGPQEMHRLYNPWSGEHFYTADPDERDSVEAAGWTYEGIGWTAPVSGDPVYRVYNSYAGDHHYTLSVAERDALVAAGWTDEGVGWYSDPDKTVPLYREYNPNMFSCNHNYTANKEEHDYLVSLGWTDEGEAWYGV